MILKFKTNIRCGGCINNISRPMNEIKGIGNWKVDMSSNDRILDVEADASLEEDIIRAVTGAGYHISRID